MLYILEGIWYFRFLFSCSFRVTAAFYWGQKGSQKLNTIPECHEGHTEEEPKGPSKLSHQGGEGVDEDLLLHGGLPWYRPEAEKSLVCDNISWHLVTNKLVLLVEAWLLALGYAFNVLKRSNKQFAIKFFILTIEYFIRCLIESHLNWAEVVQEGKSSILYKPQGSLQPTWAKLLNVSRHLTWHVRLVHELGFCGGFGVRQWYSVSETLYHDKMEKKTVKSNVFQNAEILGKK